ncbi:uncharacterized protein MAM_06138 [Metarhizium album ARSEF 1941]|uniref:Methyltransferase domain-containing protein n=1 Tax=Metarhizium album (strain ARSEF 1941) TaxID=1081103 RepID=A0A0B2WPT8_METAS|nr:uncharacterized protein MAM_06138 [Metarhizium album ARSEF 1941]KHN96033.1 hypothetical protein MAM_06138 [Metarhizium album ARSEF 1941]
MPHQVSQIFLKACSRVLSLTAMVSPTLPSSYDSIEDYTAHLCHFLDTPLVRQITGGIHVNDALLRNGWQALPQEWTDWWSSWPRHRLAQQDLIDGIDEGLDPASCRFSKQAQPAESRPASLTDWLARLKSLALPRSRRPGPTLALPEALTAHMKPKKVSEVSAAAAYIHNVCQRRGITRIVDMGSGQGYLSISLAYLFPYLRCLAMDGSETQVAASRSAAAALGIPETRLKQVVHWVDGSRDLAFLVEDWAEGERCMLVGLHACGSLSEHMARYFATVSCIDALAVVGCCYNHIVPRSPASPAGFPISSALRERNVSLSATALMTACQAPNNWTRPSPECVAAGDSMFSKRRLYRSILEKLLHDKGIKVNNVGDEKRPRWGIRKQDMATFIKYARRSMDCTDVAHETITDAELMAYEERYSDCEGQIAILWTLGVLCSKVVESLIAMDRYCYLQEQGAEGVDVVPIFDFKVSPRNLMVVAEKAQAAGCNH